MNHNPVAARPGRVLRYLLLLLIVGGLVACAPPAPAADESGLQITLVYDLPNETLDVRLADADGAPVTDAVVSVEGNMNHAGMVPVTTEGVRDDADGAADGLYTLPFGFTMWGDWILTVTAEQSDGTTVTRDIDAQVTGDSVSIAGMPSGGLQVTNLRARPAPLEGGTAAVYLTVINGDSNEEQLTAAASPAAEAVELHETVNDNGVMRMVHQPEGFVIPPGGTLEMVPGGKHVMLIGLTTPLAVGDTLEVTLTFAHAGEKVFEVPVVEIEGTGQTHDAEHAEHPEEDHSGDHSEDHSEEEHNHADDSGG